MSDPKNSISRRDFLCISGIGAAGAFLASCTPPAAATTASSKDPVQLVYQDWRTEWFPGMAQEMLAEFHVNHPNIRVFFTPDPENFQGDMLRDMEAETVPDVFAGCCDFYPVFAQKGYTLDLQPYVDADLDQEIIQDWSTAQYQALALPDGTRFALPKYHGALALNYNKDIFDKAGVSYPDGTWTYDDYLSAMQAVTLREGSETRHWGSMFDVTWDRIQVHVNSWWALRRPGQPASLQDVFPACPGRHGVASEAHAGRARDGILPGCGERGDTPGIHQAESRYGGRWFVGAQRYPDRIGFPHRGGTVPHRPQPARDARHDGRFQHLFGHETPAGCLGADEVPDRQGLRARHGARPLSSTGAPVNRVRLGKLHPGGISGEGARSGYQRVRRRAPERLFGHLRDIPEYGWGQPGRQPGLGENLYWGKHQSLR